MEAFDSITLEPMSAGDIIDRAVRLYRRNFIALVRIVLAPSLVAYAGGILYDIGRRNFSLMRGDSRLVLTVFMIVVGMLLWLLGKAAFYAVLGGASRSLVYHFFDGAPLRARDVYQAVRERLWSLIGAMFIVSLLLAGLGMVIYFIVIILFIIYAALAAAVGASLPGWMQVVSNVIFGVLIFVIFIAGLLLLYSRVVYVPQVLMVESKSVYHAISRSFSLASGELLRIGALILFWFYVAWSLWLLLMLPLGWYGYWMGVDINPFSGPFSGDDPIWYSIAKQTMTQLSEILIAPIAMLGFTLLYIDSRVRKEGFDVELMANRVLPPPPHEPPAEEIFGPQREPETTTGSGIPSILGLYDYGPILINRPGSTAYSAELPIGAVGVDGADRAEVAHEDVVHENVVHENDGAEGETRSNEAATIGHETSEVEINFDPVDAPNVEAPAVEQKADTVVTTGPVKQERVATVQIESSRRLCQWCSTEAGVEDRFCRVCGSVF
jgi:hypothetical protein